MSARKKSQEQKRERIALWGTAACALLIAYLTLTPSEDSVRSLSHMDKLYHLLAFMALIFPTAFLTPRTLKWILPAALVFGGAIELIQPQVGRTGEWLDFGADALGAGLGALIGTRVARHLS